MDESYLKELHRRKSIEESDIDRLSKFKAKLLRELNQLRNEREECSVNLRQFTEAQIEESSKRIRESREHMKQEMKKNRAVLKALRERAEKLVEDEDYVRGKKQVVARKEESLSVKEEEIDAMRAELEDITKTMVIRGLQAASNRQSQRFKNKEATERLAQAKKRLDEIKKFEEERRANLLEKESIVNKEYKIIKVKEELMEDGLRWVKDQNIKIDSQWQQLAEAKEYLTKK